MTTVSVITGAGGMGVPTARNLGTDHHIVLFDNSQDRLDAAVAALDGIEVTTVLGDVTDRAAVDALFATATGIGPIASVVHTAGVSPSMGDAEFISRINALGTVNVDEALLALASGAVADGAAIVNVASMAAHLVPAELIPETLFPGALTDPDAFVAALLETYAPFPAEARSGFSYAVSKGFVKWYSSAQAERFTAAGIRIVSVSPGSVDTEMGRLEAESGAGAMVEGANVPRWGTAQEMADLFTYCVSDKAGYLTGTDILNDGGVVASMRARQG
ncbi:SDR family oxidoreductase [Gordonia amarae]|uniref:SDR family oxidoreductase n=1 Tax=Gordonia amarae TaxID=36821 RepID=A0A857MK69_9ACTN|nr:SDR family oxidoreductase [Gordonia amarae]MCS3876627.1 NAD(P)-dependent dehydrogenase (short-subunit alcohol dehydrogenase family) [Gordonia amarae]QHN19517.1 SDR family oxidoreductase [Gordonia amarae]QHN23993.1 SDR family oxidoreductase [Gordonia amarae]QHN32902.1 SDR family oxidoreductase [Gordonia amarae]QHN41621.1 SDR family oxidoreductase [Gordonia amarae]